MKIQKPSLLSVILLALGLLATVAQAETVNAVFNSPTDVPVTASSYTAAGNTVNFTLNFAPEVGTELMVVKNTGLPFINGTFDNLVQGQLVTLTYGGTNYYFVANYYGGSGNDLVLLWASNRPLAWGYNYYGQLGDGSCRTDRLLPIPVFATGLLAGKTVVALSCSLTHSLALCSDGVIAAWGDNYYGELGDNTTTSRLLPVAVNTDAGGSALAGKTVVAIAAGEAYSLALCSDGTVVSWGRNNYGQLGDNATTQRNVPVAVNTTFGISALYGKTVAAIAAGGYHSLALCSDGSVVAWGRDFYGQLGDNASNTNRLLPVAVNTTLGVSALYGRAVVAIAAGSHHSLVLCSDGTVAAWGANWNGQLGENSATQRTVPVAVNAASGISALYGKSVMAVAAGYAHSLALCSDGSVVGWGWNSYGQLGDNTTATQRLLPVAVNTVSGVSALYGKKVLSIAAGQEHSLALCSDGTSAAWGGNDNGQLGDGTTNRSRVPIAVNAGSLAGEERFARLSTGGNPNHTVALVARPLVPSIDLAGAGILIRNGNTAPTLADGTDFGVVPAGSGTRTRSFRIQNTGAAILNLTGTPRVAVSGPHTADFTVPQQPASPVERFTGTTTFAVAFAPSGIGTRTAAISIASDDSDQNPYTFAIQGTGSGTVDFCFHTANDVALTTRGFTATGSTANLQLGFAPVTGAQLTVVNNTGLDFIAGTFDNLTNGQMVALSYGGTTYTFVANYYGGSGNDLVLTWAKQCAFAWGNNAQGQVGDNTSGVNRLTPVPVSATGVLTGKTVLATSASSYHSLAVCSDGTVAAWGVNGNGQLGDDTSNTKRLAPVAVSTGGASALAGKRVAGVAAGMWHSLALCSDGTVAGWGSNYKGQLGDNTTTDRLVPKAVSKVAYVSALYGKTVVGIAAGAYHSLALCSDGTIAAWGDNSCGQLGINSTGGSTVPVAVNLTPGSALYGKTVLAIAAGAYHNMALCSDGTLAAWGDNTCGQLGDTTSGTNRLVPVVVSTNMGFSALYGKTVVAFAAGGYHNLVLCGDGTLAAWGRNSEGQLGDNTTTERHAPTLVDASFGVSALFGRTAVSVTAGWCHSLALCSDSTVAAWGDNTYGELGDSSQVQRNAAARVDVSSLASGSLFAGVFRGSSATHTLALVALPPAPSFVLTNPRRLLDGSFQFGFTNTPGAFFGVLATTNAAAPASDWIPVGDATEVSPGQFQFTDPGATNSPQRFYRVRSP